MDDLIRALTEQVPPNAQPLQMEGIPTRVIAFLAIKWQEDNQNAASQVNDLNSQLERAQTTIKRLNDQDRYNVDALNRLRDRERTEFHDLDANRLRRRLTNDEVMDLLWACYGPRNFNTAEKIPAIKMYRIISGLGLKEAKDIIDQDWESRQSAHNAEMAMLAEHNRDEGIDAEPMEDPEHNYEEPADMER